MIQERKPFCCRKCGKTLAITTSDTIESLDGVQLLVAKAITLRCVCGKLAYWRRLVLSGSLLASR